MVELDLEEYHAVLLDSILLKEFHIKKLTQLPSAQILLGIQKDLKFSRDETAVFHELDADIRISVESQLLAEFLQSNR
ncbi:hypothetical protein HI914_06658 [Erysiphe necator]|nr:hypothetical protein HI914_06658 [Erysiphe necator]